MNKHPDNIKPLGVAVWGIGAHAKRTVLPAIANSPYVRLVGIHSRNTQVIEEQATQYGCRAWSDIEAMLSDVAVDVVFLATPTALHFEQGCQILEHGKHLWCEKPLATHVNDAEVLVNLAKSNDLSLAVVCAPRYHPMFEAVNNQLEQGKLGELKSINAAFRFPHIEADNFRYNPELGGGALLDLGFYLLSVVDAIVPGDHLGMECQIQTEPGYRVDTSGQAKLTYNHGVAVDLSWGFGFDYENQLIVKGSAGELIAKPFFSKSTNIKPFIKITDTKGSINHLDFVQKNQFEEMIAAFCCSVSNPDARTQMYEQAFHSQLLLAQANGYAQ